MNLKKKLLIKTVGVVLLTGASTAHSANWLALQGTEPDGQSARARVWGFVQPEYAQTEGTKLKTGPWKGQKAIFNQIRPDLNTNKTFNVLRARIGVRGTGFPLDNKVNYFFLAEFGDNGITRGSGGSAKLTDASVTLSHIPGARIRVGQFKTPGSEEGLQAIHVFDYINFTNVTNGMILERFFNSDGSVNSDPSAPSKSPSNKPNGSVSAFRDVGIQFFDIFKVGKWEHSYAVMFGNGNGITRGDNNNSNETYLYWSSALIFGGKGARRQSWKMFAWNQSGKRTLLTGPLDSNNEQTLGEFDRKRYGLGTTFRKNKYRAAFEYMKADGMIFNGTDGGAVAGSISNDGSKTASWNMESIGKANGWYGHFGYMIMPQLELDLRYDVYNRMTDVAKKERKFETVTLGGQWFFNKKSRLIVNYEFRDASAPNLPGAAGPNKILSGLDDKLSAQILVVF